MLKAEGDIASADDNEGVIHHEFILEEPYVNSTKYRDFTIYQKLL
jgi:hypothetical protein